MKIPVAGSCLALIIAMILSACSAAKLEARLEANPQCKDVVNPKTGALMPCPGSDKAFYRAAGLVPAAPSAVVNNSSNKAPLPVVSSEPAASTKAAPSATDCKPQIHKKTGGALPCPSPD